MLEDKYAGLSDIVKFALWLIGICVLFVSTDSLKRWDQLLYDSQLRWQTRPVPEDVLIVAVDEASLATFGRWPWRRDIHAQLINRLTKEHVRVIAMDFIFAEPDARYPEDDAALAKAIKENGKVILPILGEQTRQGSPIHETLPIPQLISSAAGLGHIHIELDSDGIARSVYLKAGLAKPSWPAFSLATLQLLEPDRWRQIPGVTQRRAVEEYGSLTWVRDHHVKIPYYGGPGHFSAISYADVVAGKYPKGLFENKIVFVGATATGLGDSLPTPVSGLAQAMSGVEINATIFSAIRANILIEELSTVWRYVGSLLLILLPVLFYPVLRPKLAWIFTLALFVLALVLVVGMLRLAHIWFPILPVLVTYLVGYPLWSWRRLEFTMHYMDNAITLLHQQRGVITTQDKIDNDEVFQFLRQWIPLSGLTLFDVNGKALYCNGDITASEPVVCKNFCAWETLDGEHYWYKIKLQQAIYHVGVLWRHDRYPNSQQTNAIYQFVLKLTPSSQITPKTTLEVLQSRTQQVQQATNEMLKMKRFVEVALDQLADAVLVFNSYGQIVLSNKKARSIFDSVSTAQTLDGKGIWVILQSLITKEQIQWSGVLNNFFQRNEPMQIQARVGQDMDVLVNLSPMYVDNPEVYDTVIVNIFDISQLVGSERRRKEALSFLTHDLRSPLSSIINLTELMLLPQEEQNFTKNTTRIKNFALRAVELAEEFIQIARIEENEIVQFERIDLIDVASNALDQVWEGAQAKSIQLKRVFELTQCVFYGDAKLLERAFINLLGNAIKYSKEKTNVMFAIEQQANRVVCRVADEGFGIPKEDIPYILDRFRRVEKSIHSSVQGLGLGLAFVKVVVERHRGSIHIDSIPGVGTKIEISLPLA